MALNPLLDILLGQQQGGMPGMPGMPADPMQGRMGGMTSLPPGFGGPVTDVTQPDPGVTPDQTSAEDQIMALLNPVQAAQLTKGQRAGGAIADAINSYFSIKYGRPNQPSVTEAARQRNIQDAYRQQQANQSKAEILSRRQESGERRTEREEERTFRREEIGREREIEGQRQAKMDKDKADALARGEAAQAEDILSGLSGYGLSGEYDLSTTEGRAGARGKIIRAQMEREQEDKLELKEAGKRERSAADERATREAESALFDEIEGFEENMAAGNPIVAPDPSAIRKNFYAKARRRLSPEQAERVISEFEKSAGPAIDAELKRRQAIPGQQKPIPGMRMNLPGQPAAIFPGFQQGLIDLLSGGGGAQAPMTPSAPTSPSREDLLQRILSGQ